MAYAGEDAAMITATVTGLDPDQEYEICIVTMAGNEDWAVLACEAGGTLTRYDMSSLGAFNTYRIFNEPPDVDYYQIPLFQVSDVTEVSVNIDDLVDANTRVWGIAYRSVGASVPEPAGAIMFLGLMTTGLLLRTRRIVA